MPSLVSDLTPLQRAWLYENQRTFGEDKYMCNPSEGDDDMSRGKSGKANNKASIFRSRVAGTNENAIASSPSWNANQELDGEAHLSAVATDSGENSSPSKRRKVYPPSYAASREVYYDFPPQGQSFHHSSPFSTYGQPQQTRYPAPFHPPQHQYHHRPPPHLQEIYLDNPRIPSKPVKRSDRENSPLKDQVFPTFPHQGEKLTWNESYENLLVYKNHYGDCNVPQKYKGNVKLGGWVNKQRKKNRNPTKYGSLKKDHFELLTKVGFKWE
jgi:hypothetical protein